MSATRVVVTGLGTTSPVGGDVPTTWAALLAGHSGVRPIKHDWADQLSTQIAAEELGNGKANRDQCGRSAHPSHRLPFAARHDCSFVLDNAPTSYDTRRLCPRSMRRLAR